ncbi:hypothetical protein IT568_05090, partial [bacterium]|nr:hypothetical protein [bacterium]
MFRKNVLAVCFLAILATIANSQINYSTLDFKVEITNPKVKIGEKLAVEITVKNISDQNIWFNKKGIYFIEKLKKGSVIKPELAFSGIKTELANEKDFVLLAKGDSFTKTLFFPLQEKIKIDGKEQKVPLVLQNLIPTGDQKPKLASYKM